MEAYRAQCPVPGLAEALEPYIKTRQEAAQIRDRLRAQLEHDLSPGGNVRLTAINLHDPGIQVAPDAELSPSITGVHRAYFEALKAHTAAQAKYNALKADLEKSRNQPTSADQAVPSNSFTDHLLPLLREREKRRRIQVIERAYDDISAISEGLTSLSIDRVIARDVGPPPDPPSPEATRTKPAIDVDARIIELKKALLMAQDTTYHPSPRTPSAKSLANKTPEIIGLEEALNELTIWMEKQLGIMSDPTNNAHAVTSASLPSDSLEPSPPSPPASSHPDSVPSALDIQDLYADYISARESLIHTIRHPPIFDPTPTLHALDPPSNSTSSSHANSGPTNPHDSSSGQHVPPTQTPSELLLPYIPHLLSLKQNRETLAQQSSSLRRQLVSAEAETKRVLARLAGESHLVSPEASRGADWAEASAVAAKESDEFVEARAKKGEQAVQEARRRLAEIKEVRDMAERLK